MTKGKSHSHIGRYLAVFGVLMVLTVLTVGVSLVHLAAVAAISVALVIAITKGGLVAGYFMHLIGEHKAIYWVLILTAVFFFMLILVPMIVTQTDYQSLLK